MTKIYNKIFEDISLYEMSNFFPEDTGLPYVLWITTKSGREKHEARVKIANSDGEAIIMIWGTPEIKSKKGKIRISGKQFKKLSLFIELNREALLAHWSGEISSGQLAKKLKKV